MGRRDLRELRSRLLVLVAHLLKWQVQPEGRTNSWSATIGEQRRRIASLLRQFPSMRSSLDQMLADTYDSARRRAAEETGCPEAHIPAKCAFTADEVLSSSFLPD